MQYLDAIWKTTEWSLFVSKANHSISVIQVYALTSNAEEAEVEQLYEPTRPSRTNTQKRCPFHHRGLEYKSRKSRNTWSNRQIGLGVQNEAGQRLLIEFCQENTLVTANTTREDCTHGHHQMVNTKILLITFFAAEDREALYSHRNKTTS